MKRDCTEYIRKVNKINVIICKCQNLGNFKLPIAIPNTYIGSKFEDVVIFSKVFKLLLIHFILRIL